MVINDDDGIRLKYNMKEKRKKKQGNKWINIILIIKWIWHHVHMSAAGLKFSCSYQCNKRILSHDHKKIS